MLDDFWLTKTLDRKTLRFMKVLKTYREEMKSRRHTLSDTQHQKICIFWLDEIISIPSTDCKSGDIRLQTSQKHSRGKLLRKILR